jgi:prepilin-type N-terminal cleavage/methylation domain-containing protein
VSSVNHQSAIINQKSRAFTLVELLVVIVIIGILIALLLPAVQAAREAARQSTCANNMKQMGVATVHHEVAHKCLPSGGWGFWWVGDPDLGLGKMQPGGWIYSLLPYMDQEDLYNIGSGLAFAQKKTAVVKTCTTPLPAFNCPSRRACKLYPMPPGTLSYRNLDCTALSARGRQAMADYAANAGTSCRNPSDRSSYYFVAGPNLDSSGNIPSENAVRAYFLGISSFKLWNGSCVPFGNLTSADISDGTSNTVFAGEKSANPKYYETGSPPNDHQTMYIGHDWDVCRCTEYFPPNPPLEMKPDYLIPDDISSEDLRFTFGSAHPNICHFVFCDGSVHAITYGVDPMVQAYLCNRHDGKAIDAKKLGL